MLPSLHRAARLAASLILLCLVAGSHALAAEPPFAHSASQRDGIRYEALLKSTIKRERSVREWRAAADKALSGPTKDHRAAAKALAAAVVLDEQDAEGWLMLARALLAIPLEKGASDRLEIAANANGAAYLAYERAKAPATRAQALDQLVEALKRRSLWRPAIGAAKARLGLEETPASKAAYEALRNEHGFRMIDYKVEHEAASPRLCLQFSEPIAKTVGEIGQFVALDGRDAQAAAIEDRQICLEGLAHGKRYAITLRAGLPSATAGETLLKTSEIVAYVRDRSPSVRLTANTYVLPSRGQAGIPLVTVNTEKVAIEIFRIGDRNLAGAVLSGELKKQLSGHQVSEIADRKGQRIWKGDMAIRSVLNEDVTTAVPVGDAVGALKPGVYLLQARPSTRAQEPASDESDEESGPGKPATQWFIVSDLGLTALTSEDGLHAFVRSLATAEAAADVEVRLLARNNEVLATARTDARGYVRFEPGLAKGEGGLSPSILVAERTGGGDYAFLDMTGAAFDLTDRGVAGRDPAGALEAQLFSERGVYRPGETVHLTAIVRDRLLKAPKPMPMTLIVSRPDGVEHKRMQLDDQGFGGRVTSLALSRTAMTGTWRARLHADAKAASIGEVSFLVEDFVPERLDLAVTSEARAIGVDAPSAVKLKGRYLYGPPAADLAVEGEVIVRPRKGDVEGFKGYRFGRADEQLAPQRRQIEATLRTDAQGEASMPVELPALQRTARPLEAQVIARLRETGGRAIERSLILPVDFGEPRVGIKPQFSGEGLDQGEPAHFEVLLVGTDGKPAAEARLKWELKRIETRWQWFSRDGSWSFDTVKFERRVADGTSEVKAGAPARITLTPDWGRYKLEVSLAEAPAGGQATPLSSVLFTSGAWGGDGLDTPEMLDVALDKPSYRPGDTARVTVAAQGPGRIMVAALGRGLAGLVEADAQGRSTTLELKVGEDWAPGAYVTAFMYRPLDEKAKRMPGRSLGLKWAELDKAPRTLKVGLDLPQKLASGSRLVVPVKLDGLAAGEQARLVVAAVDVGILNLTRYEAPSPERFFYGQRRLGTEIRDLYGRLIDGMRAQKGALRSGGDGGGGMAMEGSPPVETPLALFSGLVIPGSDGTARVELDLPPFNGTVRVMATAWSADKVGAGKGDVIVRDPLALLVTTPRFLVLGDEARVTADLHNVEGAAGSFKLTVLGDAGSRNDKLVERAVALKAGERRAETLTLKAQRMGPLALDVRVEGPGGIDVRRRLALDVKPPGGEIRRVSSSLIKGAGGKLTLGSDLLGDLLPERARATVTVGPAAGIDVAGLLLSLDRYPYGCAEQTTSRALPLVYVNEMAKLVGLKPDDTVKERVQKAIERLLEMQDGSGAFGVWGPSNGDPWLTAYVADFLTRAREAGFVVQARPFGMALDRLQNNVATQSDFEKGGEDLAYALYVLARNGRAPIGELRYYADTRLERFSTALARTQLGAALAMLGDKARSERAFRSALELLETADDGRFRHDYGSGLRDGSALLTLASETRVSVAGTPKLASLIAKALSGRQYTSTQENAWMVLAARALIEDAKRTSLSVDGRKHAGPFVATRTAAELASAPLAIVNDGPEETTAVISATGDAATPEPAAAKGFTVERLYYTLDGKPVEAPSAKGSGGKLTQNQRLVAVVKVTPTDQREGRLLVVDRLPAGLEIENPRLLEGASLKAIPGLEGSASPQHSEFRDDRFVAAVDLSQRNGESKGNGAIALDYIVRAVTPGRYVHPALTVEDMYRPERYARSAAGQLEIVAKE